MNKKIKCICAIAIAILAAINLNLTFNSNDSSVNLSLSSIVAMARGENYICSVCGKDIDRGCNCDIGITCSFGSCWGKQCHDNTYNWSCPCSRNGNPFSYCA